MGLTAGARRRTPGLRREEVAQLAGMSVDYYTRMEQSRGPRPSRQMLTALARALRLTEDERDHLFHLTGEQPPRRATANRPPRGRNMIRRFFLDPAAQELFPPEDRPKRARELVAGLRAVASARPTDPGPTALVAELRTASEEFAHLWDEHEVAVRRAATKRFRHPAIGILELDCEVLVNSGHNQQLVIHTARPGTESYERLQALRLVVSPDLTPTAP
ncbi:helix-turn-helix transcriptional regulator [Actinacidiphila paucisporea]|uniref:Helix-turn-helix domain-containing protein n=1 Tax=Actinacidiphila paucisporea TaxID=310782 RepID=A0A1M7QMX4_9ACTN|nr:helix-turn-helix transcriptional regulator [Actinacidiphila paucisporea]SHN32811.1 Helix-turn-helix domain-containing protein [Actinacidiphila paucisporea]